MCNILVENTKRRAQFKDTRKDAKTITKLLKQGMRVWIEFSWLGIELTGRML
jgi:hypothetical protein